MTLQELDEALTKLHLDLTRPCDMAVRNKIVANYGQYVLESKEERCSRCWIGSKRGCPPACELNTDSQDSFEVGKRVLERPNDINLMSFICLFVIPVYEETTGEHGFMNVLSDEFHKRWRKERGHLYHPTKC